jgi:uncharacterized protein (DUF2141 family)
MHPLFLAATFVLAPLAAVPTCAAGTTTASPATLTVSFTGIATPKGVIMVALYDAAGWDGGKPVRVAMIDANGTDVSTVFTGLAPGRYAIKSFHDINGDGKMDTNPFGLPVEPFAFSNDAHGEKGVPSWDAAAFDLAPNGSTQRITIR